MEEAETKQAALDQVSGDFKTSVAFLIFAFIKVADLEEELGRVSERLRETEGEAMSQQVSIKHLGRNYTISLSFEVAMAKINSLI